MGWANSSLRPLSGLPPLPASATKSARGVVLEDPPSAAWAPGEWGALRAAASTAGGSGGGGGRAALASGYEGSRVYEAGRLAAGQAAVATGGAERSGQSSGGGDAAAAWHTLSGGGSGSGAEGVSSSGGSGGDNGDDWGSAAAAAEDWAASAVGALEGAAAAAAEAAGGSVGGPAAVASAAQAAAAEQDLEKGLAGDRGAQGAAAAAQPPTRGGGGGVPPPETRSERLAVMLGRLSALPWRRIDVNFGGATWGLGALQAGGLCLLNAPAMACVRAVRQLQRINLPHWLCIATAVCMLHLATSPSFPALPAAHNNIQVTRQLLNFQVGPGCCPFAALFKTADQPARGRLQLPCTQLHCSAPRWQRAPPQVGAADTQPAAHFSPRPRSHHCPGQGGAAPPGGAARGDGAAGRGGWGCRKFSGHGAFDGPAAAAGRRRRPGGGSGSTAGGGGWRASARQAVAAGM